MLRCVTIHRISGFRTQTSPLLGFVNRMQGVSRVLTDPLFKAAIHVCAWATSSQMTDVVLLAYDVSSLREPFRDVSKRAGTNYGPVT